MHKGLRSGHGGAPAGASGQRVFLGFRHLLEHCPKARNSATLIQVATPSRQDVEAYADIRRSQDVHWCRQQFLNTLLEDPPPG